MTETLAHGYSSESTEQELSDEYQHDRVFSKHDGFQRFLRSCSLDESSLSIGRVKIHSHSVKFCILPWSRTVFYGASSFRGGALSVKFLELLVGHEKLIKRSRS